jgi:hypothetical protein
MCFAWVSEQTAIISLYSINLTVLVTKEEAAGYKLPEDDIHTQKHIGAAFQTNKKLS